MYKLIALSTFSFFTVHPALASSDEAWALFAADVEQGCLDATKDSLSDAKAVVDPFGSQSFGLALVTGKSTGGAASTIICVFDKQSKAVEIGGELEVIVSPTDAQKP